MTPGKQEGLLHNDERTEQEDDPMSATTIATAEDVDEETDDHMVAGEEEEEPSDDANEEALRQTLLSVLPPQRSAIPLSEPSRPEETAFHAGMKKAGPPSASHQFKKPAFLPHLSIPNNGAVRSFASPGAEARSPYPTEPQPLIPTNTQPATPRATTVTSLPTAVADLDHRTGYVYDERMTRHKNEDDETHPETPVRILKIYEKMQKEKLLSRMKQIPARPLMKEEALKFHSEELWTKMTNLDHIPQDKLTQMCTKWDSVYLNKYTGDCAKLSAGGVIEICHAVWEGKVQNGFAIVRPPGHHAEATEAMGFCVFNNCVLAAHSLKEKYGAKRICILDWDVHHGNGIQRAFIDDGEVLYISLHRYDNATFYPHNREAGADVVGEGAGTGRNVNIPWPCGGMGDPEYIHAFNRVIVPILTDFQPEMIIVAAGFDAAQSDPLGGCLVTPSGYFHMTAMLKRFARGKIVLALEGGYTISAIPECAASCVRALLDDVPPLLDNAPPRQEAIETMDQVCMIQGRWWHSVHGGGKRREDIPYAQTVIPLRDILSQWRENLLSTRYHMVPVFLSAEATFPGKVYATADILETPHRRRMLFIHQHTLMHYPTRHGGENVAREDEAFLPDMNLHYLTSMYNADFATIDVDIHTSFTGDRAIDGPIRRQVSDVLLEVYDNLLRSHAEIYIVAMGPFAAQAAVQLIKERDVEDRVRHIFSVPIPNDRSLPQLDPATVSAEKIKWYYRNSHVVVRSNVFSAGTPVPLTADGYGLVVSSGSLTHELDEIMYLVHDDIFDSINTYQMMDVRASTPQTVPMMPAKVPKARAVENLRRDRAASAR